MTIQLDMLQSAGVGALALALGICLTRRIPFLQKYCIPSPVSGGLVFSLLALVLHTATGMEIEYDTTLQDFFLLIFFTSVGFQSNMKVLKSGGKLLVMILVLLVIVISAQNLMPLGITKFFGLNPLIALMAGSMSMTGGHGTVGGFASLIESLGLEDAATIGMAAATFGLVAGSMLGGPLAEFLIRHKLKDEELNPDAEDVDPALSGIETEEASPEGRRKRVSTKEVEFQHYAKASYWLIAVVAAGTLVNMLLKHTDITFPTYFGALIFAAIVRNIIETTKEPDKHLDIYRIVSVGNIALSLFLGMALVSLKLWQLAALALPLVIILLCQVLLMIVISYFIAFPMFCKNYDAAILVAGLCGFGLGATPNAMANMSAVCYKYHYTVKPFLIVPIVGAMFSDLINTSIITLFLSFLK